LSSHLVDIPKHVIGLKNPCENLEISMRIGKCSMIKNDENHKN
jgi:hypothetical protein